MPNPGGRRLVGPGRARVRHPLAREHLGGGVAVTDELVAKAEPGLIAIPSGKFFGWVMGGTLPAALAADRLVSAWDHNTGLRYATPAAARRRGGLRHPLSSRR